MNSFKKFIHKWSWTILIVFCIAGLFYPFIGVAALICMMAPVLVSFFKGRLWCGNFCPRGSFNDVLLSKLSRKLNKPIFLKQKWFRILFFALLMGGFAVQLFIAWGNISAVGAVFVRMIIITTILSVLLGITFNHRTWCTICPMGTMAHFISKSKNVNKRIGHVTFDKQKCVGCKVCTKSCPVGIDVLKHKDLGKVAHADCLKCEVCIEKCPKDSLYIA